MHTNETRPIGPTNTPRATLMFLGIVFLAIGVIALGIGGSGLLEALRYRWQSVQIAAVVTGKTIRRATAASDTSYELRYRFTLADKTIADHTETVPVHVWEGVEQGLPVAVEYRRGETIAARVIRDTSRENRKTIAAIVIGAAMTFIAIVAFTSKRVRGSLEAHASVSSEAARIESAPLSASPIAGIQRDRSYWFLARHSFGFWFGAIASVIGLLFFFAGGIPLYNDWRFAREGRSTTGLVLTKEIKRSGMGRGRSSEAKRYEATYRFTVEGRTVEGRDELSREAWERLVEREAVQVRYRPARVVANRLAGARPWKHKIPFTLVGSVLIAVGGTAFGRAVRDARLEWRLRAHGVAAQGTITELQPRNLKVNEVQLWRLQYQFSDFLGRRHVKTIDLPESEAELWSVGQSGRVLYDSARPADAVWVGRE
jgi:hypothetical protein